jgi:transcription-repair coupling factor (superfamily II helicase)
MNKILHLPGSAISHFIGQNISKKAPMLFIARNATQARIILQETQSFLPASHPFQMAFLPAWELLPYDHYSPCSDITSERLKTLSGIIHHQIDLLILTPESMMLKLPPKAFIHQSVTSFEQGQPIDRKQLSESWLSIGYKRADQTQQYGEFSIRGSVIDVFPQGSKYPIRLDLFDDQIHSIRTFHPQTQLSIKKIPSIEILPLREFDYLEQNKETLLTRAKKMGLTSLPDSLLNNHLFPGAEFFLPVYHDQTATIWDYINSNWRTVLPTDLESLIAHEAKLIHQQYLLNTKQRLDPQYLWSLHMPDFANKETIHYSIDNNSLCLIPTDSSILLEKTIICSSIPSGREKIKATLQQTDIPTLDSLHEALEHNSTLCFYNGYISKGFINHTQGIAILPESVFSSEIDEKIIKTSKPTEDSWDDLNLLKPGDYCIHPHHGLGQFIDICQLNTSSDDFLKILYANGGHIFVNIQQAHILKPYLTYQDDIKLDTLGSKNWEKRKQKAKKNIELVAAQLIATYSTHQQVTRTPLAVHQDFYEFCEAFPFKPTPDQEKATLAIIDDAKSPNPVSRLLCADVGFGKTEIMMRSSYIYASQHKQVLVLAPTTLLAEQHFETFTHRFKDQAIHIGVLSREKNSNSTANVIQQFNNHQLDILIGTHKLLYQALTSEHIDLVIIDEEHHFGVKQKNHFMQKFPNANFMNVSATPIPRSLGMAFGSMLKLLLMTTPPPKRFAVNTELHPFSTAIIQNAILRETHRQGQVFYVLNRIAPLESRLKFLEKQMPTLRFGMIHGQMPSDQIKRHMQKFTQGEYDVLLSTAIIESGIDIPNANTLIIERADLFGTAQLHQLRGRVGRSSHAAYAYLLIDEFEQITPEAQKRLQAIVNNQSLGDGYRLATQDMELRGIGEILGEKQSGHIRDIGYGTYIDLLNEALHSENHVRKSERCQINTHEPGAIEKKLFQDFNERIKLYRLLSSAENPSHIDDIERQIIDRCGMIPSSTKTLLTNHRMQIQCYQFGIYSIEEKEQKWVINYRTHTLIPHSIAKVLMQNISVRIHGPKSISLCQSKFPQLDHVHHFLQQHH